MATPNDRQFGLTTYCSAVDRWALVCITCELVLSVAQPVDFSGKWLYPHPDHERHELVTVTPEGKRVDGAALAATAARSDLPPEGAELLRTALAGSRAPGRPAQPIRHGTTGGYRAHTRRGSPPCDACKRAAAAAKRRYDRAQRSAADDGQPVYVCNECDFTTAHLRWIARHTWAEHERPPTGPERVRRKRAAS